MSDATQPISTSLITGPNYEIAIAPAFSIIAIKTDDPSNAGLKRIDCANAETAKGIVRHPSMSGYDDIVIKNNRTGKYLTVDGLPGNQLSTNWGKGKATNRVER